MRKFLIQIALFILIGLVIAEVASRFFVFTSDIPMRTVNTNQIQKYVPDQQGYWKMKSHKWQVNHLGWPGPLPDSYDNLVTVIGDSFIENFMNPDSCHQSVLLKKEMPNLNFMEAARSGVSLIEAFEIKKELDTLNPKYQLIYASDSDFEESIAQIHPMSDVTQFNLKTNQIAYGKLKSPGLKKILYNWKFVFYLYRRFSSDLSFNDVQASHSEKSDVKDDIPKYRELIDFIHNNYVADNVIIVLKPNTNPIFQNLLSEYEIKFMVLDDTKDKSWSFDYDAHWTCYGHERASLQVSDYLRKYKK
ncbi:hypothetical protein [Flagellimonas okinawensis]|uniref:SGNH/GDSL hydrolase family protein n=1 Tax=Flagellimonas okinawensis TaxID=3031324 RepID=A0ABT5XQZ4_9FLAO|nr:hypothetical protein [[Muricauda] okinawensis]MDF0708322.1 hypothetical protein [[Muricauda] okinawensis]